MKLAKSTQGKCYLNNEYRRMSNGVLHFQLMWVMKLSSNRKIQHSIIKIPRNSTDVTLQQNRSVYKMMGIILRLQVAKLPKKFG